jgi:hypothetical protein
VLLASPEGNERFWAIFVRKKSTDFGFCLPRQALSVYSNQTQDNHLRLVMEKFANLLKGICTKDAIELVNEVPGCCKINKNDFTFAMQVDYNTFRKK